jgi:hypothetical protein
MYTDSDCISGSTIFHSMVVVNLSRIIVTEEEFEDAIELP